MTGDEFWPPVQGGFTQDDAKHRRNWRALMDFLRSPFVAAPQIAAGAVSSVAIADNSITTPKLVDNAVIAQKLADASVLTSKLADASVIAAKLNLAIGGGNMLRNSGFQDPDVSMWSNYHDSAFVRAVDANSYQGGVRMDCTSASDGWGMFGMAGAATVMPAGPIVLSAWVISNTAIQARVHLAEIVQGDVAGAWVTLVPNVWTRVALTRILTDQRTVTPYIMGNNPSNLNTLFMAIDAVQLEIGDVPTAWAPKPDEILPGTVGTTQIADDAITTPKLIASAVTAAKIAAGTITATQVAANTLTANEIAANAITSSELAANSVIAGKIATNTIVAQDGVIGDAAILNAQIANLAVNDAKIADLSVGKLTAGTLQAAILLAGLIKTANSGQRVEIDSLGVRLLASDNSVLVDLPTDGTHAAVFNGERVDVNALTTLAATLRGATVVDQLGSLSFASTQPNPASPPTLTESVGLSDFDTASGGDPGHWAGLWWDGANYWYVDNDTHELVKVDSSGTELSRTTLAGLSNSYVTRSVVKIGSYWYGLTSFSNPFFGTETWYWKVWNDSAGVPGTLASSTIWSEWKGAYGAQFTTDGTNIYVCQTNDPTNNKLRFETYTVPGTGAAPAFSSAVTSDTSGAAFVKDVLKFYYGSGDFGATRLVVATSTSGLRVFNTSGVQQDAQQWADIDLESSGLVYNGSAFVQLASGSKAIYTYTGWTWSGGGTKKYHAAYTWYDNDGTTHETSLSPRSALLFSAQRRRLSVSWPTIPDNGGADDPNAVRIYLKEATTDPGAAFASYFRQGSNFAGTQTYVTSYNTGTAGSQDTAFTGIGTPATLTLPSMPPGSRGTGAAGRVLYDTDQSQLLVNDGVFWMPPAEAALRGGSFAFSDFMGGVDVDPLFKGADAGTGTHLPDDGVASHPGIWFLGRGTAATDGSRIFTGNAYVTANGKLRQGFWIRTPANLSDGTNRYTIWGGLIGGAPTDFASITNGILFRYQDNLGASDGHWYGYTIKATAVTGPTDLGGVGLVVSTWYFLEVEVNAAGTSVQWYLNHAAFGSAFTTNIPTVALRAQLTMQGVLGTANRFLAVDAGYMYSELATAR